MIYLDNAATSFPKPPAVAREVSRCIREYCGNPGRGAHILALASEEAIYSCRCALCDFFHADKPENFVFVPNATYGLNIAIKSKIRPGDRVLISDLEHNAVLRPIHKLAEKGACNYSTFDTAENDSRLLAALERRMESESIQVLICTHASNVTGRILPVVEIGRLCKKHNIYFIIDGSQSAGHIPIDFRTLDFDVFCAPGHKGLFGIQGSGFVYFRALEGLSSVIEGGSGSHSALPHMPNALPDLFEAGTLSTPSAVSLLEGIKFIVDTDIEAIQEHESQIISRARDMLYGLPGTKVIFGQWPSAGVISFSVRSADADTVTDALSESGICVRGGLHCSPLAHKKIGSFPKGCVRISPGYFNHLTELESVYKVLKGLCK